MSYEPFDGNTADARDRVAFALSEIIDDAAPMRWTRYRFAAECIANNEKIMADLRELAEKGRT